MTVKLGRFSFDFRQTTISGGWPKTAQLSVLRLSTTMYFVKCSQKLHIRMLSPNGVSIVLNHFFLI